MKPDQVTSRSAPSTVPVTIRRSGAVVSTVIDAVAGRGAERPSPSFHQARTVFVAVALGSVKFAEEAAATQLVQVVPR